MSDEEEEKIYCICRSSDISRFMIGCESCEEWYHGDCIKVTESEAQYIKHWYCTKCRARFPSLKITYHKKRVAVEAVDHGEEKKKKESVSVSSDKSKSSSVPSSSKHDHHKKQDKHIDKHRDRHADKQSEKHSDKHSDKHMDRHSDKHGDKHSSKHSDKLTEKVSEKFSEKHSEKHSDKQTDKYSDKHSDKHSEKFSDKPKSKTQGLPAVVQDKPQQKSSRSCGKCKGCMRTEDCGKCDPCRDVRKFEGKLKRRCRLRRCQLEQDVWKEDSRESLKSSSQSSQEMKEEPKEKSSSSLSSINKQKENTSKQQQQQQQQLEKEKDAAAVKSTSSVSTLSAASTSDLISSSSGEFQKDARSVVKEKVEKRGNSEKEEGGVKPAPPTTRAQEGGGSHHHPQMTELSGKQFYSNLSSSEYRQCFGPGCVQIARRNSKYCSDDCGLNLATNRIFEILPQRIQQWQASKCEAEENNKRTLDEIRHKQRVASERLMDLEAQRQQLESVIAEGKKVSMIPDTENTDADDEAELNIFCFTCGLEVTPRMALRHMEKCYNKIESQTSFGSIYKTRIEGESMFCDFYNPSQKTYCKRLKVICPEHTKEPRISADEVCGCPLVLNVFEEQKEFCRMSKRKCVRHHCWEKLRRAQLDMERLRQWMLLDELFEQERQVRTHIASRAGVLALMLHQTIDHTAPPQISPTLTQEQQQQ